jgi:hypothetical protein
MAIRLLIVRSYYPAFLAEGGALFFNRLKGLLTPHYSSEDDSPVLRFWVGNGDEAALIDPDSGRLYAYIWHDGLGKYHPTVIVSAWRAVHLVRHEAAVLESLLSFPRCTVELYRVKADTILVAQKLAESVLQSDN